MNYNLAGFKKIKLQKFGLIPVGADAWLAMDQLPHSGSIILVHGNSNEPQGIKKIMPILQNNEYHWLPLVYAFSGSLPNESQSR